MLAMEQSAVCRYLQQERIHGTSRRNTTNPSWPAIVNILTQRGVTFTLLVNIALGVSNAIPQRDDEITNATINILFLIIISSTFACITQTAIEYN